MGPVFLQRPYVYAFGVSYAVWAVPEIVGSIRSGGADSTVVTDRRSKYGIFAAIGVVVGGGFLFAFETPWAGFGPFTVPLFWLGVALAVSGTAVRWYAVRVLGQYFSRSVSVRDDHDVVSTGPYAYVRHPTYTGSLVTVVGFGLVFGTLFSVLTAVLAGGVAYGYRIHVEETVLKENLDGYAAYCESVPHRLVPYIY